MKKTQKVLYFTLVCAVSVALVFSCATSGGGKGVSGDWEWELFDDSDNGGSSTIALVEGTEGGLPSYAFNGEITNQYEYGFAGFKVIPTDDATLESLKTLGSFAFKVMGDGQDYAVKIITSDIEDYCYYEYRFQTTAGFAREIQVPVNFLMQPSWGRERMFKQDMAVCFEFQTTRNGDPGDFAVKVWDIKMYPPGAKMPKPKAPPKTTAAAAAAPSGPFTHNLGAISVPLADNFQYGDGYQAYVTKKELFNGNKISVGETYTLKITFKASRELEDDLMIGLVDTTPAAKYWTGLSWDENAGGDMEVIAREDVQVGVDVSRTFTFNTVTAATSAATAANAVVFTTKGEGKKGVAGSGVKKSVTLDFSEFIFIKE